MKPVRQAHLHSISARGVVLDCGGGLTCRISLLQPDLARVVFVMEGVARQRRTWSVLPPGLADVPWAGRDRLDEAGWADCPFDLTEGADAVVLTTSAMTLSITLKPLSLRWALPCGTVFAKDRSAQAYGFARSGLRHASARAVGDRYYGLGDKTGAIDLQGRRLRVAMLDALGYDPKRGDPLYKHWPFLITETAGGVAHGIYYDNLAEGHFDLGCEHDNYFGLFRSYEAIGGDLDYYIFPGPDVLDVTRKFLMLTGKPALPPRWTLGFAQTAMAIADSENAQARMEAFIDACVAAKLPIGAFHFGSGYTSIGPKRYVFTWNRAKYPDPEGLLRKFHAAGMHVVANLKPCLLDDHPRYAEPAGAYVNDSMGRPVISQFWDGEGAHLDFTHEAAIAWWQKGVAQDVLGTGFDSAWNDNNEYGFADDDAVVHGFGESFPLDLAQPLQSLLMTRASIEATVAHRPGERPFTISRAGMPGVQRYAQSWTGDNDSSWTCLAYNIRMGLTMSLSGLGNTGHDIGGFSGPVPGPELLVRWTQAGVVHPRMIMNSWKPGGVFTSPFLHPEVTPLVVAALRLRARLVPYLYSLMYRQSVDGTPPMLPTLAVFPADGATRADHGEIMLGPWLLAAPVVEEGARSREVYLPAGPSCWFDFYSGERLAAGGVAVLAAPLERLPLVVREGALVPVTGRDGSHDEPSRSLLIFPGLGVGESAFTLFEDDGISAGGAATLVHLSMRWSASEIAVEARVEGDYALPWPMMTVSVPAAEQRPVVLVGPLVLS